MEYLFSKDRDGTIIHISQLTTQTRHDHGPFRCLGCGAEMVAALGEKNAHHFRHKAETSSCSRETYLHQAAKQAVVEGFKRAKDEGRPYPLRMEHPYACPLSTKVAGLECRETVEHDLTSWFEDIDVETGILGFVADLLLSSSKSPPLLIEIEVTHACEVEKISSGLRIIEVKIASEEDISALRGGIDTTAPNVRAHGLSPKTRTGSCKSNCAGKLRTFVLYKSGKTWLGMKDLAGLRDLAQMGAVAHIEIVDASWRERDLTIFDIDPHVQRAAYQRDKKVRSCLLCQHHAFSAGREGGQLPIWCLERKGDFAHNEAAQCRRFELIASPDRLAEKRKSLNAQARPKNDHWMIDKMIPGLRK